MARMKFVTGTYYWLNQQKYRIQHSLVGGRLLVDNLSMGVQEQPAIEELHAAWAQGKLRFAIPSVLAVKGAPDDAPPDYAVEDFHGVKPERHRNEAWRRYQILKPLLRLPRYQRTRANITAYVDTLQATYPARPDHRRPPLEYAASVKSVERWLRSFEESAYDIRALVPGINHRADKGVGRLDADVERCIQATIHDCKARPAPRTVRIVQFMVVNKIAEVNRSRPPDQQLTIPSLRTVYDRIQDAGPEGILRRRASQLEAQAQQPYLPGLQTTRIMERVQIDISTLDLFVVDDVDRFPIGRPTVTAALDDFSLFPVGLDIGFEPGSYRSVMNCLRHGILPKVDTCELYGTKHPWLACGLPETLVVDNGRAFIGEDLKDACGQLGINLEPNPKKKPWLKGKIERFFKTNNTSVIHGLPGTSFSNVVERGDYEALKHACISLSEFLRLLHIYLLDMYAQDKHTDLGIIPAHRWIEGIQAGFEPSWLPRVEEVQMALYPSEWRTISRGSIDFECLRYSNIELEQLHTTKLKPPVKPSVKPLESETGASESKTESEEAADEPSGRSKGIRVRIKYDPGDLQCIYVIHPDTQKPLEVKAVDPIGYTKGLSIWKHRVIRRYAQKSYAVPNIYDLAEAYGRIQDIVDKAYEITRKTQRRAHATNASKTSTRTTAARFNDKGTGGLPTPATLTPPDAAVNYAQDSGPDDPQASLALTDANTSVTAESPVPGDTEPSPPQEAPSEESATSTLQKRPSRSRGKKKSSPSSPGEGVAVAPERPPLDLSGWSADYGLRDSK